MAEAASGEFAFDFSGGELCLDFANTVGGRGRERPTEHLSHYPDLVAWAQQAGVLTEHQAGRLLGEAQQRAVEAGAVLGRAIALREAIYRIFAAVADGRPAEAEDLGSLNAELSAALRQARIVPTADGFGWDWAEHEDALDQVLWPVTRSAAELLTDERLSRVRTCGETRCGWLFLDTSRNRSRQWCDMKVCGNRVKARRHHARRRAAAGPETVAREVEAR